MVRRWGRIRMIVAFVEVESDDHRHLRYILTPPEEFDVDQVVKDVRSRAVLLRNSGNFMGSTGPAAHYWCAADKPDTDQSFMVKAVYRTSKVPADARCEKCGCSIAELQKSLNDVIQTVRERTDA